MGQNIRQKKDHETRKKEILDTAERFFLTEGYEKTSIQGIIDAVGIAKGTFYHYFSSKEELLQEWLLSEIETVIRKLEAISKQTDLTVLERFTKMYSSTAQWKASRIELVLPAMTMFYDDKNIFLRQKLNSLTLKRTSAIYSRLIAEGTSRGEFQNPFPYPEVAAKLILTMGTMLGEELADAFTAIREHPENREYLIRHMQGLEYAIQRIIGVEDGSFQLFRYEMLDEMIKGVTDDTDR